MINNYLKNKFNIENDLKEIELYNNYIENEIIINDLKKEIENINNYINFIENKENEIFIIDLKETIINNLNKIIKKNNLKYTYKEYLKLNINFIQIKLLLNKKLLKHNEIKRNLIKTL